MGQQIAIAQDRSDEDAAMLFLRARGEFLALPRFQKGPTFRDVPAGRCEALRQLLVLKSQLDLVLATAVESDEDPGHYSVDFSATRGMLIEWTRTVWREQHVAEAGRFYLASAPQHDDESLASVTRAMTALQRFIRSKYPARSSERYPVYVGPGMWERVEKDKVRILSSAGAEQEFEKNG
jgi:hypothetical protein